MAREARRVLFACGQNALRSPMAAALYARLTGGDVLSAGVVRGELDPFAVAVLNEIGIDIARHRPATFDDLAEWDELNCDLIITLSPEAHHRALELAPALGAEVEYWPTPDPTAVEGNREQRLEAYRQVRDLLMARIRTRFSPPAPGNE